MGAVDTPSVMQSDLLVDSALCTVAIYALRDPRDGEIRYIGKAEDPVRRLRQHMEPGQLNRYRSHKNSWLKGLLDAGYLPELEIVDWVEPERADAAEIHWIAWYRMGGSPLTNGTDGGDGGAVTDPDARARISAAHVGRKASAETRAKMSASHQARCAKPEERERMRRTAIEAGNALPVHPGEKNPMAKLSDAEVRRLRQRAADGELGADLAKEYGITAASASQIITGKTRSGAGGPIREARQRTKLSASDVEEVRRLAATGMSQTEIGRHLGVSQGHVSAILSGAKRR